ncbi:MAG: hemolysin III family protein [Roseovarius sp.]
MSYPNYTKEERIADGAVHVLGIGAALIGAVFMFSLIDQKLGWGSSTAVAVYAAALVLMLSASGAYHLLADTSWRPLLRRIDHAAIYVKIAGTITPFGVMLGTSFAYLTLMAVWAMALIGAATKLMARRGQMGTGWLPQFLLAAAGVVLIVPLSGVLPTQSLALLMLGGVLYTAGIVFYCRESLRYANAIWHVFVLLASASFYFGISTAMLQVA